MSEWSFVFAKEAEKDLEHLDSVTRNRVLEKINWLKENFDLITPLPLGGQWRGFFKLRVGDWRIVYEIKISDKLVIVHYIDRRDKIYKRR